MMAGKFLAKQIPESHDGDHSSIVTFYSKTANLHYLGRDVNFSGDLNIFANDVKAITNNATVLIGYNPSKKCFGVFGKK